MWNQLKTLVFLGGLTALAVAAASALAGATGLMALLSTHPPMAQRTAVAVGAAAAGRGLTSPDSLSEVT